MQSLHETTFRALGDEPWVHLADAAALADFERADEIAYNQANRQTEKYRFFARAFDFLTDNRIGGDYYEFGCHRARTFRMALTEARRHRLERMRFLAFDSFAGLPEPTSSPDVEHWRRGALATSEEAFLATIREHGIYTENVRTVKGFYDATLTRERAAELHAAGSRVAFACVDCDLYESAVPVLRFLEPLLQEGSVVYLDDLFAGYRGSPAKGVARAFGEFRRASGWRFVRHMDVGWWGRSYVAYRDDEDVGADLD